MSTEHSHQPIPDRPGRTPAKDEVLRRIGRNLVTLQQLESLLKHLALHAGFSAPVSQFAEGFGDHADKLQRRTLGDLINRFLGDMLQAGDAPEPPAALDEPWLATRVKIEIIDEDLSWLTSELKLLLADRNELVHHFLPRWQLITQGDDQATLAWLDDMHQRATALIKPMQAFARSVKTAAEVQAMFAASAEGAQLMELHWLRGSRLVALLGKFAMTKPRRDGWADLSSAGHWVKRQAPDELVDLQGRFGHRTLKAVLAASGLFDLRDEAAAGGGARTVYRVRPGSPPDLQ